MTGAVVVRGRATAEEVAAVVAALHRVPADRAVPDRYELWRAARIAALTRDDRRPSS